MFCGAHQHSTLQSKASDRDPSAARIQGEEKQAGSREAPQAWWALQSKRHGLGGKCGADGGRRE